MINLEQIQILAQLAESMEISALNIEKTYNNREVEGFNKNKQQILNAQNKILEILKQNGI